MIDSWDGERAYIKIDDKICWEKKRKYDRNSKTSKICGTSRFSDAKLRAFCRFTASKRYANVVVGTDLNQKPNDESFGIDNIILSSNKMKEYQACRIAHQKYQWVNLKPECRNNFSRIVLSQKAYEKNEFANPCVLQTSSALRGGERAEVKKKVKVVRESLAKGMVTFCDSVSGGGKCCKLGGGKHRKRLTKGKCPGDNRISYISIPEGCTVVVCTKACGDKDTVHHYLGPGNHIPPEFPDNKISDANVCVSCFFAHFYCKEPPL